MSDVCPRCQTDHEGHIPGSLGAEVRCLQTQAEYHEDGATLARVRDLRNRLNDYRDRILLTPRKES